MKKLMVVVAVVRDDRGNRWATVLRAAAAGAVAGTAGRESEARGGGLARRAALLIAALLAAFLAFGPRAEAFVYWANNDGDTIGRAKLDGTGVNPNFITDTTVNFGSGVAVDRTHIYWTSAGSQAPSNEFSFGKAKKNKRKGTAKLTVAVPGSGELDLAKTKKVKADEEPAEDAGGEKLVINPKGKAKKKLNKKGKAKVTAEVTYTRDGGEPNSESKKIRLVKR